MPHHLRPVPRDPFEGFGRPEDPFDESEDELDGFDDAPAEADLEHGPLVRPAWWRWVAIAVIVALVATGPLAWALSKLLS